MSSAYGNPPIHRTPMEEKYLCAYFNDDNAAINVMLKMKEIDPNQKIDNSRLLSTAIDDIRPNIVKTLIENGANIMDTGMDVWYEEQPFHRALSKIRMCQLYEGYGGRDFSAEISNLMSILEILMGALEKASKEIVITMIFAEKDDNEMTLFLIACHARLHDIIVKFLNLISVETQHFFTDMAWFIDGNGESPFHSAWRMKPDTVSVLIDRLPFSDSLINLARYHGHSRPLHLLAMQCRLSTQRYANLAQIGKLLIAGSADPDACDENGSTPLHCAVRSYNQAVVETLLRAGCQLDMRNQNGESPLVVALLCLRASRAEAVRVAARILEMLIAFGVDLQKEEYLFTQEDIPELFSDPIMANGIRRHLIPSNWLEACRQLRRSNKMNSLKRMCRNAIRQHLKPQADEVIKKLTCIPTNLKSYLLVENEPEILTLK